MKALALITGFFLLCNLVGAQENRLIRVGVYENPPKIFTDDNGNVSGFHGRLVRAIAELNSWEIEFVHGNWLEGLERTESGEIDFMVDVAYSVPRTLRFDFNEKSIFVNWASVYGRKGYNPQSLFDLEGARIAGLDGGIHTDGEMGIVNLAREFNINIELILVEDYTKAFELIDQELADAAVVNRIFGASHEEFFDVQRTSIIFNPISIRYAFPKKDSSRILIQELDEALTILEKDPDSIYYKLLDEYLAGFVGEVAEIPSWVWIAIIILVTVLGVFLFLIRAVYKENRRRKASEKELLEARHLAEAANAAKSTFLANMTHEIRTPMNAVLGYTEILLREKNIGSEIQNKLKVIHKSGRHLLGVINNVLDMSSLSLNKIMNYPVNIPLETMLQDVLSFFQPLADQKGLLLKLTIKEHVPPFIISDEKKLRQILINLLGNALKFTEEGSIELSVEIDEKKILYRVIDSGPGISREDQEKIFEAFMQSTEQRQFEGGTGLGLAISLRMAQVMEGELILESSSNLGTSFLLKLPLILGRKEHSVEKPKGTIVSVKSTDLPVRILAADDKQTNLNILKDILIPLGIELHTAKDGQECLNIYQEWNPQLVILDILMPNMDGIEATKAIRKLSKGNEIKILAVSASTLKEDKEAILKAGADDFLYKPFWIADLLDKIHDLLGIEYVYEKQEEETEKITTTVSSENVSKDLRKELIMAAQLGSRKMVLESLEKADLASDLTNYLEELVNDYNFREIIEYLDKGGDDGKF